MAIDIEKLKIYMGSEKELQKVDFAYPAFVGKGQFLLTTLDPMGSWIADGTWTAGHDYLASALAYDKELNAPAVNSKYGWLECKGRLRGYHTGWPGHDFGTPASFHKEEITDLKISLSNHVFGNASGSMSYTRFNKKQGGTVYIYGYEPVGSQIFMMCYDAPFFGSSMTLQLTYF